MSSASPQSLPSTILLTLLRTVERAVERGLVRMRGHAPTGGRLRAIRLARYPLTPAQWRVQVGLALREDGVPAPQVLRQLDHSTGLVAHHYVPAPPRRPVPSTPLVRRAGATAPLSTSHSIAAARRRLYALPPPTPPGKVERHAHLG